MCISAFLTKNFGASTRCGSGNERRGLGVVVSPSGVRLCHYHADYGINTNSREEEREEARRYRCQVIRVKGRSRSLVESSRVRRRNTPLRRKEGSLSSRQKPPPDNSVVVRSATTPSARRKTKPIASAFVVGSRDPKRRQVILRGFEVWKRLKKVQKSQG